ncbi:hypothetical protein PARPLA_02564 [Rhodobacteraceae bacterium THAF1]|uniref:DUF1127 domain-containing protein n=1 Tax=Palleronia sp. THAF1 TaxID=2587842 RepID=UPI000F3BE7F8|nr:DUF1127 domain-containing protein [Palleronia sp. THAF1]QFU08044.1 hypothetical protein FIU81_05095 [Palleronia sp. THAF1]VDC27898.1 hypothetical protein PARPLA_02564 [Rhodobacteraceae bacterium THAF1]
MASISDFFHTPQRGSGVRRFFTGLGNGMAAYMERNARTDQIRFYQQMSDADLAARGMQREDIVRHVYRDRFFL